MKTGTRLFLSYCWDNTAEADTIDGDFKKLGLSLTRDTRNLKYRMSIPAFMDSISEYDYVIVLISDGYFKRPNCLYELSNIMEDFREKAVPVLLDGKYHVFDKNFQEDILRFWKQELDTPNMQWPEAHRKKRRQHIRHYIKSLRQFFAIIKDLKLDKLSELRKERYVPLLQTIELDTDYIIGRITDISNITDLEEREVALEQFMEEQPDNLYGMFQRARLANEQHRKQAAIRYYEKLLALYPDDFMSHYNLATILTQENIQPEKAYHHFWSAMEIDPYYDVYNNLGLLCERLNRIEEAISWFRKSMAMQTITPAYSNLGNLYYKQKEIDKAIACYKEGLTANPDDSKLYYNLGHIHKQELRDYEAARLYYLAAIQKRPDFDEVHTNLAIIYTNNLDDHVSAKHHYKIALDINPRRVEALSGLAQLLQVHTGEYEEAKLLYKRVLVEDPERVSTYHHLATLLYEQYEDSVGALDILHKALLLHRCSDTEAAAIHYMIAQIKYASGDMAAAFEHNSRAVEYEPENSDYQNNLAIICFKQQDYANAIIHFQRCIDCDPGNASAYVDLAISIAHKNQTMNGMRDHLLKALSLDPDNARAHYIIAYYYKSKKNNRKYETHYKRAMELGYQPNEE